MNNQLPLKSYLQSQCGCRHLISVVGLNNVERYRRCHIQVAGGRKYRGRRWNYESIFAGSWSYIDRTTLLIFPLKVPLVFRVFNGNWWSYIHAKNAGTSGIGHNAKYGAEFGIHRPEFPIIPRIACSTEVDQSVTCASDELFFFCFCVCREVDTRNR